MARQWGRLWPLIQHPGRDLSISKALTACLAAYLTPDQSCPETQDGLDGGRGLLHPAEAWGKAWPALGHGEGCRWEGSSCKAPGGEQLPLRALRAAPGSTRHAGCGTCQGRSWLASFCWPQSPVGAMRLRLSSLLSRWAPMNTKCLAGQLAEELCQAR